MVDNYMGNLFPFKLTSRTIILLSFLFASFSNFLSAQSLPDKTKPETITAIEKKSDDIKKVMMYKDLATYYFNVRAIPDSSIILLEKALALSKRLRDTVGIKICQEDLGRVLLRSNRISEGMSHLSILLASAEKKGDKNEIARLNYQIGRSITTTDSKNIPLQYRYLLTALSLYDQLKNLSKVVNIRIRLAMLREEQGHFNLAEKEYLELINYAKEKGYGEMHVLYFGLSSLYEARNIYPKELIYLYKSLNSLETAPQSLSNDQTKTLVYFSLTKHYNTVQKYAEVKDIAVKGMQISRRIRDFDMFYSIFKNLASSLFYQNKYKEALSLSINTFKEVPPSSNFQRRMINGIIGKCYLELNKPDKAEPYYLEMNKYVQGMSHEFKSGEIYENYLSKHYIDMAELYVALKKYQKASTFLHHFEEVSRKTMFDSYRLRSLEIQIKIDTAKGDFRSAFLNATLFKKIYDSIGNLQSKRAVADLVLKYGSDKKDQDILLGQKNLELLKKQQIIQDNKLMQTEMKLELEKRAAFQQQQVNLLERQKRDNDLQLAKYAVERQKSKISLLNKESLLHYAALDKEKMLRNIILIGLAFLLIIIGLLIYGYNLKIANNRRLLLQKNEIDSKNQSLKKLVSEKEWLLKEIHHRVKNNLQIIMSLLHTQSFYLKDPAALGAIKDSRNRVHSISLMHKKLYQEENIGSINLKAYIREIVDYLRQSFSIKQEIRFDLDIADLLVDPSQAVPIGLILNEAITNSIKYAFPSDNKGVISIKLTRRDSELLLNISDDGIGLQDKYMDPKSSSLGLELIQGLSSDLNGICKIKNDNGTSIFIKFPYQG